VKSKTKKRFHRVVNLLLAVIFIAGWTLLFWVPSKQGNPTYTPPPLNSLPQGQQNPPQVVATGVPGR
jgi:hypothetical protein